MSVFDELGVRTVINAAGTVTRLGGARMSDEVRQAWLEAAGSAVSLEELQAGACTRIAQITGTEAALVTGGSAASLTLGSAAMLAGHDLGAMLRLPDTTGLAAEVVVARDHRSGYDHCVRAAGARLVEVGFNEPVAGAGVRRTEVWEYEAAFGPDTAGVHYALSPGSQPPLAEVVAAAHGRGLPVLVDASAQLPPRSNLRDIPATGADLVCFSGGKAIGGPQSSGILCGRRALVGAAALQMLDMDDHPELWDPPAALYDRASLPGVPRQGLGRGFKVAKEDIAALVRALEIFVTADWRGVVDTHTAWLDAIAASIQDGRFARSTRPSRDERAPILVIDLDSAEDAFTVCRRLRSGDPGIQLGHGELREGRLLIDPSCLAEEQILPLASRLGDELGRLGQDRDSGVPQGPSQVLGLSSSD